MAPMPEATAVARRRASFSWRGLATVVASSLVVVACSRPGADIHYETGEPGMVCVAPADCAAGLDCLGSRCCARRDCLSVCRPGPEVPPRTATRRMGHERRCLTRCCRNDGSWVALADEDAP